MKTEGKSVRSSDDLQAQLRPPATEWTCSSFPGSLVRALGSPDPFRLTCSPVLMGSAGLTRKAEGMLREAKGSSACISEEMPDRTATFVSSYSTPELSRPHSSSENARENPHAENPKNYSKPPSSNIIYTITLVASDSTLNEGN